MVAEWLESEALTPTICEKTCEVAAHEGAQLPLLFATNGTFAALRKSKKLKGAERLSMAGYHTGMRPPAHRKIVELVTGLNCLWETDN